MKKLITGTLIALMGLSFTLTAAHAAPPQTLNERQREQRERIQQGRRSGELTRAERARLAAREAEIRRREARYRKSGGRMTAAERARLERELNQTSRAIHHQKHDRQGH